MATAWVILSESEADKLRTNLLRGLPRLGWDGWLSRLQLGATEAAQCDAAVSACRAVLVLATPALLAGSDWRSELALARVRRRTVVVLRPAPAVALPPELAAYPAVDFGDPLDEGDVLARRRLGALLPPAGGDGPAPVADLPVEAIEWNEEMFSEALHEAASRHDASGASMLLDAFGRHIVRRLWPYPERQAINDLQTLRRERAFETMCHLAEAHLASGTKSDRVRRLYAQALIETGALDRALEVLQSIIDGVDSTHGEVDEAFGLVGRVFKQRYVEDPTAPEAPVWLQQAIGAYAGVFERDSRQAWHGVNAASCLLRAVRDGVQIDGAARAKEIARKVLAELEHRERVAGALDVWDCASRVEALIAIEDYAAAEVAVDAYLRHRDMHAFEVNSTYRQFDQLLQLGRRQPGRLILERLRGAVARYRTQLAPEGAANSTGHDAMRSLLIRLADSRWEPSELPDLVVQSRMGTVVTARGSDTSVSALLADPRVISVDQSRPVGAASECDRSLPFVRLASQYSSPAGTFDEHGDAALVAVIDDGIDVLHHSFRNDAGASRIVGVWDQTAAAGTPPTGFDYGHFHDSQAIAAAVAADAWPPGLPRNDEGHGTHVASIAVGRAVGAFAGGMAPAAKLLVVIAAASGPTGYSACHVDALVFIDRFAKEHGLPVVVNLSQGMNAGAHDGKSALEVAFDAFAESGRKPGRVVVKSAGNERDKGGHALLTLPTGSLEQVRWLRSPDADVAERLELWWSSADQLRFRLRGPALAHWTDWVDASHADCSGTLPDGGPYHLSFTSRHIDNGDSLLSIELGSAAAPASPGEWLLEVHAVNAPEGGTLHAWIERTAGTPSRFLDHTDESLTLSIPGTAASVIAVGAVGASWPVQVGKFSSYGPTRDGQRKPLVCAPGVGVRAARGGSIDGAISKDGTSMAAPHVTGAVALLLSRTAKAGRVLNANQIAGALRQKTQNFNGRWDRGQGWGVLDVGALLAAF
jgi:subtilisin family serine protease